MSEFDHLEKLLQELKVRNPNKYVSADLVIYDN